MAVYWKYFYFVLKLLYSPNLKHSFKQPLLPI
nr:MAG TPA: hypothetical protein [Caudoviricetes sp.]